MSQKGFAPILIVLILVAIVGVAGYFILNNRSSVPGSTPPITNKAPTNPYTIIGTVKFIDLEGGFWGIVGNDGNKYDPKNLPKELQKEGMRVEFTLKTVEDQVSFRMWGTMVEVQKVVEIQATKPQVFDKDLGTLPTAKPWQPGDPIYIVPEGEEGFSTPISWDEVIKVLNSGKVKRIFQAHSLEVTLTLKDGKVLKTKAPKIDVVWEEVRRCGTVCEGIGRSIE